MKRSGHIIIIICCLLPLLAAAAPTPPVPPLPCFIPGSPAPAPPVSEPGRSFFPLRRGTSVSALVKQFLVGLAKDGDENERLKKVERALREGITAFRGADRLPRDEVHTRET